MYKIPSDQRISDDRLFSLLPVSYGSFPPALYSRYSQSTKSQYFFFAYSSKNVSDFDSFSPPELFDYQPDFGMYSHPTSNTQSGIRISSSFSAMFPNFHV